MEELLRFFHVIGAVVLLGTGGGIAFFFVMANRSRNVAVIAHVARTVVIADWIFTATAVVLQPITGILLAIETGWPLDTPWIVVSLALYVLVGLFWLPVVGIQIRLRDLAGEAAANNNPLPPRYHRLFRVWFACGYPAFVSVLAILWLMLARPALW